MEVPAAGTQSQGRRKSLVGPSIAERVRQLTSMLDSTSAGDAARSVPGTPTLHGQREKADRAENVKSPFFFKTFMLPFRSSSEECLTEQTDFIYVKGGKPNELIEAQAPSENATASNTSASVATPLTSPGLFVRKVASSFRIRKKKATDESKSLPQSPTIEDKVFVLPLNRTPPEEKRLSGDITAANALVSATTMLMSTRLLPSSYVQSRSAKSSVAEKGGKEKRSGKELLTGRKLANQVSDSMLKSSLSKKHVVSSSSLHSKSLASFESSQESSAQDDFVPLFVRKCVEFIEREGEKSFYWIVLIGCRINILIGMTTEGLYRVPGNQSQVVLIEQKFMEKSDDLSLDDLDIPVNAVTTALKNFFASLSEPLVSCALYKPLIEAMSIEKPDERTRLLRQILQRLPPENRATLRYFLDHLRCVARNVSTTAMDHRNISKCLWPTLVRPEFDSFETMAMMTQTLEDLVLVLLENPSIIEP
ncbi:RhoGAP domain containing protein [Trichuris trichiura]|uniref:RhoGAP domain containing protein n=1 Tax=Trichuris trichiura TaxID=36087 RepID=A0A077Z506_TRITR|nr:RhoGAP domain containing protein [Trichuris trichiura]